MARRTKDLKDCFAYRNKKCAILTKTKCDSCSFYKTREEFGEELIKTLDRLITLDKEDRIKIMEKYYLDKGMK